MSIPKARLAKIKAEYQAGKITKTRIAAKNKITRKALRENAEKAGWLYGKNKEKVTEMIEEKTMQKIADKESDKAADLAIGFLDDVVKQKKLINVVLNDYAKSISEQQGRLSKADASRVFEAMKVNKITMETLLMGFQGAMKAMGIYKEVIDHKSSDGSMSPKRNRIEDTVEKLKKILG